MTDEPRPDTAPGPTTPPAGDAPPARLDGYSVKLATFEGPLDLLLHLIEEHALDILDIPIAFVASKYVEYIKLMDELNIDVASEYLVMAATLTHIKSKMLLPVEPPDQEDEAEVETDPRAELVRRLLEYQKYKQAAHELGSNPVLGRDIFSRGVPAPQVEGMAPLAGLSLFKLLDAFQGVLSRAKRTVDHNIDFERFSITDRINELSELLQARGKVLFEQLFEGSRTRADLIVTFLAILEMTRLRLTRVEQQGPLEPIFVELAVVDNADGEAAATYDQDGNEEGAGVLARRDAAVDGAGDEGSADDETPESERE